MLELHGANTVAGGAAVATSADAGASPAPAFFLRRFAAPVIALVILTLLASLALVLWSVAARNDLARATSIDLVATGYHLARKDVERSARLQTHWTDAYNHVSHGPDPAWLKENWGAWTNDAQMALVFLLDPANRPVHSVVRGAVGKVDPRSRFAPTLQPLVARARALPAGKVVSDIIDFDGRPAIVAAARITPDSGDQPSIAEAQHVLIIGRPIDSRVLGEIAAPYHIKNLTLSRRADSGPVNALVVRANDATPQLTLYWPAERPGDDLPQSFWGLALLTFAAIGFLAWLILRNGLSGARRIVASEARATFMALHDPLTGLPNRMKFRDELVRRHDALRPADPPLAVLFIDLDGFKPVNDTLGHAAGDKVLQHVAAVLAATLGANAMAARMGGDEFAALLWGTAQPETAEAACARIRAALDQPFSVEGEQVSIGASLGVAFLGPEDEEPGDALRRADIAMYEAKKDERNGTRFYSLELEAAARHRQDMTVALQAALGNDSLSLLYQPQICLHDGHVCGVEALLRWRHPQFGLVSPRTLLPLAEQAGLSAALADWTLAAACRDAARWPDLPVGVNIAAAQLRQDDFVDRVAAALAAAGLPAERLELEITEDAVLDKLGAARRTLDRLRTLGVRVALDDFGAHLSSLQAFHHGVLDKLKLERALMAQATWNPRAQAVLRAVAGLGRSVNLAVVVEGIETASHLALVREAGATLGQGYFFAEPMTATDLERWLESEAVDKLARA